MLAMYRETSESSEVRATRYVLVERELAAETGKRALVMRRYSLARLGPSPRSALGVDRHERLERVAEESPPNA